MKGLAILADEERVHDLLRQKTGPWAFIKSALALLTFVFFVMLLTLLALGEPLAQHRSFDQYLRQRFDTHAAFPLDKVVTIEDFWDYTNRSLMPALFGNDTRIYYYPDYVVPKMLPIEASSNRLLGVLRIRSNRVLPNAGCKIGTIFSPFFPSCYGPFSLESEEKEDYGPDADEGGQQFKYQTLTGEPHSGTLSEYSPNGYAEVVQANHSTTVQRLAFLQANDWIGPSTRMLTLEFTVLNFNLGIFGVCKITFEIAPSGDWMHTFDIEVLVPRNLSILGNNTTREWLLLIGEAFLVLFVIYYLIEEFSEFGDWEVGKTRKNRFLRKIPGIRWGYFLDGWNLLDLTNLALIIAVFAIKMMTITKASNIFAQTFSSVQTFTNLLSVAKSVREVRLMNAFNVMVTWVKVVKYITFIPYIQTFMFMIRLAWQSLVSFGFILLTIFIGFAIAYSVAFGERYNEFKTVWASLAFLVRTLIGNANMSIVNESSPEFGGMLIFIFVLGVNFIGLNLFYAIMISALAEAKADEELDEGEEFNSTVARAAGFGVSFAKWVNLEGQYKLVFPGLHSRQGTWKDKAAALEQERDDFVESKALLKMQQSSSGGGNLGPSDPSFGRRPKRKPGTTQVDSDSDSGSCSEPDLGPLKKQEQVDRARPFGERTAGRGSMTGGRNTLLGSSMGGGGRDSMAGGGGYRRQPSKQSTQGGMDDAAQRAGDDCELMMKAARHVTRGLNDRCTGARGIVVDEMRESRQVLKGISEIVEVIAARAQDLTIQQNTLLEDREGEVRSQATSRSGLSRRGR